ncbi:HAD family hydrolase [Agaribacterium haliotis]|uniref:HAD family hydrolase n=1 Tax=Agaribacterium haliotis TaxID=2013869 RepID=UPI00130415B6|nr:HAD family hydrolase [Agaribacterium haliotis]
MAFLTVCGFFTACSDAPLSTTGDSAGHAESDTAPRLGLDSWRDGEVKNAIQNYIASVTDLNSEHYIPKKARIAVFDNDGTLWSEQPMYFQLFFVLKRVKSMAEADPELKEKWLQEQPFKAALEGDMQSLQVGGEQALIKLLMQTHAGMSETEFRQEVKSWLQSAEHPRFKRRFDSLVYQPMLELLFYLRANGFKTYIVSGGGVQFMRAFAEEVYGIEPQYVIGSSLKTHWDDSGAEPVLIRDAELAHYNDKQGKPVAINHIIGRRPVFAFGNSDGDLQMLQWTDANPEYLSFQALVHHTDSEREWAYDRHSNIGRLDQAWDQARTKAWTLVDMKHDWLQVYPE